MRFRSTSIRAKIFALLVVPIASLVGLWAFATLTTTGQVWDLAKVSDNYHRYGSPVDDLARALQEERRAAVQHLAAPGSGGAASTLRGDQAQTDRRAAALRAVARESKLTDLDPVQRERFSDVLLAADRLSALRHDTAGGAISWEETLDRYSKLLEPMLRFRTSFSTQQTGQIARQSAVLAELARAREYVSQEDAAMAGLRGTTRPTEVQVEQVTSAIEAHDLLFDLYRPELTDEDRSLYDDFFASNHWTTLHVYETLFLANHGAAARDVVSPASWRAATVPVLNDLATLNAELTANADRRADDVAQGAVRQAVFAGAAGLLAIVVSLLLSVRIGRSLIRDLLALRNAAQETAGIRLPKVMRMLRRGEPVDIAAQTPPLLPVGLKEINQVGRAFDAVRRAAVEAAVEQAELRRGVSAVFVNLARRNQVLLHRQLTLLDAMERRTEDPAELDDLFRLDHLTTRMRRHAEGLIILSGGSPGRNWRRPVSMVNVVRAAVGEVEDYARVTLRSFPGTALTGPAVADVTHLIAELVENATVYSPPTTQVTVHGEVVANGFVLEIDDRGLGMGADALAEANRRLAEEQQFDLADTDRLGLFVVSRLARRHAIKVSLRPSPYGGTSAVVLLPRELLAEAATAPASGESTPARLRSRPRRELLPVPSPRTSPEAGEEAPGRTTRTRVDRVAADRTGADSLEAERIGAVPAEADRTDADRTDADRTEADRTEADRTEADRTEPDDSTPDLSTPDQAAPRPAVRPTGPRPAEPEEAPTPGGLPRRRANRLLAPVGAPDDADREPDDDHHGSAAVPAAAGAAHDHGGHPAAAPAPAAPAGSAALPRRVRQASLAPQLRTEPEHGAARPGDAGASARQRSPEEARATFASFQRGLTRGRGDSGTPGTLVPPGAGKRSSTGSEPDGRMVTPGGTAPDVSVEGNGR
ncbi:nitrate- and nitrite sensing domain-containing protein [Streptomyces sp. NPDC092296]|uniref:nitrate- and nitrite sensing domain-containing protein n=1 Tax=Streptomyces sp. NPDC092296 TaxID=3366012 RepID=UPI0037F409FD